MYLPDCYSMRFTTLSNYYLIDWWCNFDFYLFACWIDFRFCYSYIKWETGGLELASTIILVLQANRLTKCASHPNSRVSAQQILIRPCLTSSLFLSRVGQKVDLGPLQRFRWSSLWHYWKADYPLNNVTKSSVLNYITVRKTSLPNELFYHFQ